MFRLAQAVGPHAPLDRMKYEMMWAAVTSPGKLPAHLLRLRQQLRFAIQSGGLDSTGCSYRGRQCLLIFLKV